MEAIPRGRRIRGGGIIASAAVAALIAGSGYAADVAAKPPASSGGVAPVVANGATSGPTISLGQCHYEATPAHDPQTRLECPDGQVVVAVYEHGIRCCVLELR